MPELEYLKNVVSLKLDADKCIGCNLCAIVCPHSVFEIKDKKAVIINKDACMECGACAKNCPVDAIQVNAGVGCATGIINGAINNTSPECGCDCSKNSKKSCC